MPSQFILPLLLGTSFLLAAPCIGQTTVRASNGFNGLEPNGISGRPSISSDGRFIAFESDADNLVASDSNGTWDIFVHDSQLRTTRRVSVDSFGLQSIGSSNWPTISANGRFVAFHSDATNLVLGDTNMAIDVFVHDLQTGITERISLSSQGLEANGHCMYPSISADGHFVSFSTTADNLVVNDTNAAGDIFFHDRNQGITVRASIGDSGQQGDDTCQLSSLSADGRFIAFDSRSNNLVSGDTNYSDIFVRDMVVGTVERISITSQGTQGNDHSYYPSISADGRWVSFSSYSSNFAPMDTNASMDVFVHDRSIGYTRRVSVSSLGDEGDYWSRESQISGDGRFVAYYSSATNFVPGDTNGVWDVYVHDLQFLSTERVSVGSQGEEGDNWALSPAISWDGGIVAFQSKASNFVSGDTNNYDDIFVHTRWDGLGNNSIHLTGQSTPPTGQSLKLRWYSAPPISFYWLAYSLNLNGSSFGGHSLDIGFPQTLLASGVNAGSGAGVFISSPVSSAASGLAVHFEILCRNLSGTWLDSNAWTVTFQ